MGALKYSEVFWILPQLQSGQGGGSHSGGFDGLLVEEGLLFAVRVPVTIADGPEDVVRRRDQIEKAK